MANRKDVAAPRTVRTGPADRDPAPPSSPPRHGPPLDALAGVAAAVLSAAVFAIVHRGLIDDAYITLAYARNLADHFHWGLTEFRTANTATSPLNVLLLAAVTFVVRDPVRGLGVLFVLLNAAQAWGLLRLARALKVSPLAAMSAYALILLSPLMLSIVGMEMTLAATLLTWLTVSAVEGRVIVFGVLTGTLVLTRMDLGLFPLLLLLATPTLRRGAARLLTAAVVTVAPWYLFSWWALGAALPDTLVIKAISGAPWGPWQFANGPLMYLQRYPEATVISAVPAAIGGFGLLTWLLTRAWRFPRWQGLGPLAALATGAVLHYLAYSFLGPAPFHWYYAPAGIALTIAGVLGLGRLGRRSRAASPAPAPARFGAAVLVVAALAADLSVVVDRPLPWTQAAIMTNWAAPGDYERIGRDLGALTAARSVHSPGEVGTLAYYCRCDIIDAFSDRGTVLSLIEDAEQRSGPLTRLLLKVNFFTLDRSQRPAPSTLAVVYRHGVGVPGRWPVESAWMGQGAFDLTPDGSVP